MRIWLVLVSLLTACSGSPGGPTMTGRMEEEPPHPLQSNDVMRRDQKVDAAVVQHILIGWQDLGEAYPGGMDDRAKARSRWEAEKLVTELYDRAVAGEDFTALMKQYSEDRGSAETGRTYKVTPDGQFVFEFKFMGLRLDVGEVGKVLTPFGWHIIKRIE